MKAPQRLSGAGPVARAGLGQVININSHQSSESKQTSEAEERGSSLAGHARSGALIGWPGSLTELTCRRLKAKLKASEIKPFIFTGIWEFLTICRLGPHRWPSNRKRLHSFSVSVPLGTNFPYVTNVSPNSVCNNKCNDCFLQSKGVVRLWLIWGCPTYIGIFDLHEGFHSEFVYDNFKCRCLLCQYLPNFGWTKQGREQLKLCTVQQIKYDLVFKIFCLQPIQLNNLSDKCW